VAWALNSFTGATFIVVTSVTILGEMENEGQGVEGSTSWVGPFCPRLPAQTIPASSNFSLIHILSSTV
jgi:hypothetical protein